MSTESSHEDIAALAKGGRTNIMGFVLRLAARLPFLFIAGRLYGADAVGRFASALVVVELVALVCSLGEKRGLAQRLAEGDDANPSGLVFDGMLLTLLLSSLAAITLYFIPGLMFPSGVYTEIDRLIVLAIPAYALTEIILAAQAYRYDIATTVRARAVVEPWTISIMAGVFFYTSFATSGLSLAYLTSIYAGLVTALWTFLRSYGLPHMWKPNPQELARQTLRALPLATADAVEWGTRRVDIFILGFFVSPATVGVYFMAQQVASLPQKLKTSFEPILGPVITKNLKAKNYTNIAKQLNQVGYWIVAAQLGVALALGLPGEAVMGLVGPNFVSGTAALAFLLAAEVVAATAVISEAALVYMARIRNLWISVATIAFQAVLTIGLISLADHLELPEPYKGAAAALALLISLGLASMIKARFLSRLLGHIINIWRWSLIWATGPAIIVGFIATLLPEWMELIFGIPAILFTYGWIIWHRGFGPEDRVLFRKNIGGGSPPAS